MIKTLPMNLEEYLKQEYENGSSEFSFKVNVDQHGRFQFYVHPLGRDGQTMDFRLTRNQLTTVYSGPTPKLQKELGAG